MDTKRKRKRHRRNRPNDTPEPRKVPPTYASRITNGSRESTSEQESECPKDIQHDPKYNESELRLSRLLTPKICSRRKWCGREFMVPERPKSSYDYAIWRDAYNPYLGELYRGFIELLKDLKVEAYEEISYTDFTVFIYYHSSGYITPWV